MTTEHLLQALTETAHAYEGADDVSQTICEALRGVVARARRYEAQEPKENVCAQCGAPVKKGNLRCTIYEDSD